MTFRNLIFALCLPLLVSCGNDPVDSYFEADKKYYDVHAYFDNQINELKIRRQIVRKKLTKNGRSQVVEVKIVNWVDELAPFEASDINKPAWRDAYVTDTIFLQRSQIISHKALNATNPIQQLAITLDKETGTCLRVSVEKKTKNFLYSSEQKLFYSAGEGYEVKGKLSVKYLFESEYAVEAEFIDG